MVFVLPNFPILPIILNTFDARRPGMRRNPISQSVLFSLLVTLLLLVPLGSARGADGFEPDISKIDSRLLEELGLLEEGDELEIIVQFQGDVRTEDHQTLGELGFETFYTFHVLPAVYARGTVDAVYELSGYHRTSWMEFNGRVELALHETTTVIKATTTWDAEVKMDSEYMDFDLNPQSQLAGLDGSGVTVAIVDTGVDGQHPDLDYGEKLIMNLHKNGADDPWVEMENTDTSYGHGTHCAGIVAGNGDASGGQRRGVAPGANLVGLGGDWVPFPDESPAHWAVLESLEWIYDNTRPGNNPMNIKVISNSWGGAGDYEPQDSVSVICNKLTYENNVLCVFAGMNSGEGNHGGEIDSTSQQSKVPAVLSVAASTHDGKGMAVFSSRGKKGDWYTYPDITAPGVNIWATRPRYTWLGEYQLVDEDMYYMAISGTSMATPHVSGLAAIMFQAAPSLRVSEHHEDDNSDGNWGEGHDSRIHEVEYILKMTSNLIEPTSDNGVPALEERDRNLGDRKFDYAQGYGQVDAEKAIAVCLVLEKMRQDHPEATVDDALEQFKGVLKEKDFNENTDVVATSWRGEWAQLTNGSNPVSSSSFATEQSHRVYIPQEAKFLEFDLVYDPYDVNLATGGSLELVLDWDGDGTSDIDRQPFDLDGHKHYEVIIAGGEAEANTGKFWTFNVDGMGMKAFPKNQDDEFHEALIEYTVELSLKLMPDAEVTLDETDYKVDTSPWRFAPPSNDYAGGEITLRKQAFDVSGAEYKDESFLGEVDGGVFLVSVLIVGALCLVGGFLLAGKKGKGPGGIRILDAEQL